MDERSPLPTDWRNWPPIGLGLLALYLPVFYEFARTIWQTEEHGHGPIVLAVIVWLLWQKRDDLLVPGVPALRIGLITLALGLLVYLFGRVHDITILEIAALLPILAGALLALRGWKVLQLMWFPLFFVIFMIPLPSVFVDALTGPLKQYVSEIAEQILYSAGYPVGRTGVTLTVGQYQLLVADACSGLNSMYSLSALGILYLYLARHSSWIHNGLIIASILPIAFAANVIRVLVLVVITYHLGDAAGQGFLHGAAGIVLVMAALAVLLVLDSSLRKIFRPPTKRAA
jgi:exosortase B